jgi:hypothetical protein
MLELAREIQEMIEVEAHSALTSGWADLTVIENEVGTSLHLEPVKLSSAPLEIYFDSSELVVCTPGRKGLSCEFFSDNPDEIKERVQALVAAVVAGSYKERLRRGSSELMADWPGPDGGEKATREPLIPASGVGPWTTVTYEPY